MKKLFLASLALILISVSASAVTVTPAPLPKLQFFNNSGGVLSGGKIYTYEPGSTTAKITYTDSTAGTANTNPVVLDSAGRANIWIDGCVKFIVKTSSDTTLYTVDNVCEYQTSSAAVSEWQVSGLTPTYVSATSFSVPGDHTSTFVAGTRLQSTNTAGTIYSTVASSSYGSSVTTVTVSNDSGALDSGLSAVSVGLLAVSNPSIPVRPVVSKTGDYTFTAADCGQTFNADLTSAATFTLPAANAVPSGCEIASRNTSTWTLTLAGNLNGVSTTASVYQYDLSLSTSNRTTWHVKNLRVSSTTSAANAMVMADSSGTLAGWNLASLVSESTSTSATSPATLDLGTVTAGDRIYISSAVDAALPSAAATSYVTWGISKSSGTATIAFKNGHADINGAVGSVDGSSLAGRWSIGDVLEVTGSGTLVMKSAVVKDGSTTLTDIQMYAVFLKKQ